VKGDTAGEDTGGSGCEGSGDGDGAGWRRLAAHANRQSTDGVDAAAPPDTPVGVDKGEDPPTRRSDITAQRVDEATPEIDKEERHGRAGRRRDHAGDRRRHGRAARGRDNRTAERRST
jgi:hypothetical protein